MNRVSLLTNKICSIDKIKQFNYHTNIARDFFVRRIDKGDVKLNNLPYKISYEISLYDESTLF